MRTNRQRRVAEQLARHISDLIQREIQDPRIGFVTVTRAQMSSDLRHAKVFVSLMGSEDERADSLAGLQSAAGFVRRALGQRMQLRHTPEIRFLADESLDQAMRIESILAEFPEEDKPSADSADGGDRPEDN